jgi:SGNH hydrolase-like domain, acetyltransferase AlgX
MDALKLLKAAILLAVLSAGVVIFVVFRTKRKELALALCTIIFCLAAGEPFLRIFFPQISGHNRMFQYDPALGWKFIPNQRVRIVCPGEVDHQVKISSIGFRDGERDLSSKRKKRVLVLGDSFVSNVDVEEDEVFTRVMERRLGNTEVLNFGVNGYGQVQEYLLLETWFDRVHPDVIMVVIYIRNDFLDNVEPKWTYSRPFVSQEGPGSTLVFHSTAAGNSSAGTDPAWKVYRRSHVFTLINRSLDGLLQRIVVGDSGAGAYAPQELVLCRKDPSASMELMFAAMTKLVAKFREFSSAKGVPFVVVLAPSHVQVYDDLWLAATGAATQGLYDRALPNQRMMRFAEANGLLMVDLLPAFSSAAKDHGPLYYPHEQHWNREGNELVARVLVDYLEAAKLAN